MPNILIPRKQYLSLEKNGARFFHLLYAQSAAFIGIAASSSGPGFAPIINMQAPPLGWLIDDTIVICAPTTSTAIFGAWAVENIVGNAISIKPCALRGLPPGPITVANFPASLTQMYVVNVSFIGRAVTNIGDHDFLPPIQLSVAAAVLNYVAYDEVEFAAPPAGIVLGAIISEQIGPNFSPIAWIDNGYQISVLGAATYTIPANTSTLVALACGEFTSPLGVIYTSSGDSFENLSLAANALATVGGDNPVPITIEHITQLLARSATFPKVIAGDNDYTLKVSVSMSAY